MAQTPSLPFVVGIYDLKQAGEIKDISGFFHAPTSTLYGVLELHNGGRYLVKNQWLEANKPEPGDFVSGAQSAFVPFVDPKSPDAPKVCADLHHHKADRLSAYREVTIVPATFG